MDDATAPIEMVNTDIAQFPCARCGAKLAYAAGTETQVCTYCSFINHIEPTGEVVEELDYHAQLSALADQQPVDPMPAVKCGHCAAEIDRPPTLDAFRCPYCGSNIIASESTERIIRPKALLPFTFTEREARAAYEQWIKALWFAPGELKTFARAHNRLKGVYVPFWTYDCTTTTQYTGRRGEHYYESKSYTAMVNGKPEQRTKRERKTRWYSAAGVVENGFDDVLILGSQSLPPDHAAELEPWDTDALVPFQSEYLAGFHAERYQIELDSGFEYAMQLMEPVIRQTVRSDIGGDEQQIDSMDVAWRNITFKHILLPVWIMAYNYRGVTYRILINARTGEVRGDRPYSPWKIGFTIAAVLLVLIFILIIAMVMQ